MDVQDSAFLVVEWMRFGVGGDLSKRYNSAMYCGGGEWWVMRRRVWARPVVTL